MDCRSLFELELNAFKKDKVEKLDFRITVLESYEGEKKPLQIPNSLLLGVLYFQKGQYHKAHEKFTSVLNKDPKNLNALGCLKKLCDKILDITNLEIYESEIQRIRNNYDKLANLRHQVEHAYAHAFEIYDKEDEERRFNRSNDLLDQSIQEICQEPDLSQEWKKELSEWYLCKLWNLKKIFNRNFSKDQFKSKNEALYPKIFDLLYKLRDLTTDDTMIALFWAYFGYFAWKKPKAPHGGPDNFIKPPCIEERKDLGMFLNIEKCFELALDLDPDNIEVRHLYVGWLQSEERFEDGIICMKKCVEMDTSKGNYYSYLKLGEMLYNQCEKREAENKDILKDLEVAIKHLEFSVDVDPSGYQFNILASCYFLAYKNGKDPIMKSKCLITFQRGFDLCDANKSYHLYFSHARCLYEFGDIDNAIRAAERSIEIQYAKTRFVEDINLLLQLLKIKYDNAVKNSNDANLEHLIHKASYWFEISLFKYDHESFKSNVISCLFSKDKSDFFLRAFKRMWNKSDPFKELVSKCLENHQNLSHKFLKLLAESSPSQVSLDTKRASELRPRNRRGFEFDFFLIYNNKNRDLALTQVLNKLEKFHDFKGFLDQRDFIPGKTIFDNIQNASKKCCKFVLIVTEEFCESGWCEFEAQTVLVESLNNKTKDNIIPVNFETYKKIEYFNMINHLIITGEKDLEKLVTALDS